MTYSVEEFLARRRDLKRRRETRGLAWGQTRRVTDRQGKAISRKVREDTRNA